MKLLFSEYNFQLLFQLLSNKYANSEEIETIRRLVMVFDHEINNYRKLIEFLLNPPPGNFEDEGIQFRDVESTILAWQRTFFPDIREHFGSNLAQDIFGIARHIAQNNYPPKFFDFEKRDMHDLDRVANEMLEKQYNYEQARERLLALYDNNE